jgi:hypothetical protein
MIEIPFGQTSYIQGLPSNISNVAGVTKSWQDKVDPLYEFYTYRVLDLWSFANATQDGVLKESEGLFSHL